MTNTYPAFASPSATMSWRTTLLGLFLFVFGVKCLIILKYGNIVPFWDQWDGEAAALYKPYIENKLHWSVLFDSHNEHRILLSRLIVIALLELGGEWNPLIQMAFNALLHAVFVVFFIWALGRTLEPGLRLPLAIASGVVFSIPFGWENTLAGFQSQFYLLLLFSLLALMTISKNAALSSTWWLGVASCIAAYFSLASGTFTAISAILICTLQIIVGSRQRTPREAVGIVILMALLIAMLMNIRVVDAHAPLKAQSIEQFFDVLWLLAFAPLKLADASAKIPPYILVLLLHSPIILFCLYSLRRPSSMSSFQWLVLSIVGWSLLQMVSLAYGRAAGASAPRYLDLVVILIPLNIAVLFWMVTRSDVKTWFIKTLSAAWFAFVSIGLIYSTDASILSDLELKAAQGELQLQNVRTYLTTGNLADLDKPAMEIPYPTHVRLGQLLSDPTIRSVLPRELLPPGIPLERFGKGATEGKLAKVTRLTVRRTLRAWPSLIGIAISLWLLSAMMGCTRKDSAHPA
ncbi:hypothetical protein [Ancylobacter moscoviensis]